MTTYANSKHYFIYSSAATGIICAITYLASRWHNLDYGTFDDNIILYKSTLKGVDFPNEEILCNQQYVTFNTINGKIKTLSLDDNTKFKTEYDFNEYDTKENRLRFSPNALKLYNFRTTTIPSNQLMQTLHCDGRVIFTQVWNKPIESPNMFALRLISRTKLIRFAVLSSLVLGFNYMFKKSDYLRNM